MAALLYELLRQGVGNDEIIQENATYNGDGSLRSKTTFTRNDLGQLIERGEYDAKGTLIDKSSNAYDDAGGLKSVSEDRTGLTER